MKEIKKISLTLPLLCLLVAGNAQPKNTTRALTVTMASFPGFKGELPVITQPAFRASIYNIKKYGAKADGIFLNTKAINDAITACSKSGGGTVLVPQGLWLTGPIVLQSNVKLHLEKNALLLFSKNFDDYPLVRSSFEGVYAYRCQSPISATNAENIGITGYGIINGQGNYWRPQKKDKLTVSEWKNLVASGGVLNEDKTTWYSSAKALKGQLDNNIGRITVGKTAADYQDIKDFLRPNFLRFTLCKKIILEGVTFENSPAWTLHLLESENITVKDVKVKNPWYGQNTDAIDLESCKNIFLEDDVFDTGDDGICIKSGRDEEGRRKGKATENLIVNHCTVYHAHGGFVVGSEMSGGAKNLFVTNCTFIGTDVGLRFKTKRGRGGMVENIYMNNIDMKDIAGEAILFDMYYDAKDPVPLAGEAPAMPKIEMQPVTEATPQFRNFFISDITCYGAQKGIFIRGLPEMQVKNVHISNAVLQTKQGMYIEEGSGIIITNVSVLSADTKPVVSIHNGNNISLSGLQYPGKAALLLGISGERSANIFLAKTQTGEALQEVDFSDKAPQSSYIKK